MGSSGFFKGEKKKQKKGKGGSAPISSNSPVFVLPKLIEKKKKNAW